jgi:type I restriction-modification system DNA methylase subunit
LADQACGSGHILLYAFELLTHIYEEAGYTKSAIPGHILEHNLTGFEIDERAAQLAGFTLMMRARRYHRRALSKELCPRIVRFESLTLPEERIATLVEPSDELTADLNDMRQVANLGSLIVPRSSPSELSRARTQVQSQLERTDLFAKNELERLDTVLEQLQELQRKFSCVVLNPPYFSSSHMNAKLKDYAKQHYPPSKSDTFAMFIERALEAAVDDGYAGLVVMESWMFLSTFEKFRKNLFGQSTIEALMHMPYLGKGGTSMGINFGTAAFSLRKRVAPEFYGHYCCVRYYTRHEVVWA